MTTKDDFRNKAFVHEYFYGKFKGNATKSAVAAGFSEKYAHAKAFSWVGESRKKSSNKTIWDIVEAERKMLEEEWGITRQQIMDGYIRDINFDIRKLCDENGKFITDLRELDDDTALSLQSVKYFENEFTDKDGNTTTQKRIEYKGPDKKGNRDSTAKIKKMLVDQHRFVDKNGEDVKIPISNDLELANKLSYLINKAISRKKNGTDPNSKTDK